MSGDFRESEIEIKTPPFCDLLSLSESESRELKQRIDKWKGVVRVFVHPYFIEASYPRESHKDFPGHEITGKAVEQLIGEPVSKTPPIFIFEEIGRINETTEKLSGIKGQPAFMIATETSGIKFADKEWNYDRLKNLFATLGIKRIIVAGQFLGIFPNTLVDKGNLLIPQGFGLEEYKPWMNGCAGEVIDSLQDSRFSIELSNFNYPDSKRDLRRIMK